MEEAVVQNYAGLLVLGRFRFSKRLFDHSSFKFSGSEIDASV